MVGLKLLKFRKKLYLVLRMRKIEMSDRIFEGYREENAELKKHP